jgi:hypothetical protein
MKDFLTLKLQLLKVRLRKFLDVPCHAAVSQVIGQQIYEEQEQRRIDRQYAISAISRLADEVTKIQRTVTMQALWQAKHDVDLLDSQARGTHEAHTSRE